MLSLLAIALVVWIVYSALVDHDKVRRFVGARMPAVELRMSYPLLHQNLATFQDRLFREAMQKSVLEYVLVYKASFQEGFRLCERRARLDRLRKRIDRNMHEVYQRLPNDVQRLADTERAIAAIAAVLDGMRCDMEARSVDE